jgi:hypothetical protein
VERGSCDEYFAFRSGWEGVVLVSALVLEPGKKSVPDGLVSLVPVPMVPQATEGSRRDA